VQADQPEQGAGEQQHVDRVEARERLGPDLRAAAQDRGEERAEERGGAVDVDPDDRRPVRGVVPREQVAREALEHAGREQEHADDPVQLARILVGAEQEDARHVEEHQDDEDAGAPAVHAADEPAEGHVVRDVLDRLVGRVRVGLVEHREDHPRDGLDEERRERRRPERLHPVDVAGDVAEEEVPDAADEPGAFLEPVERIEQRRLELLPARGFPGAGH
jgi:hypothetical protein